jgi:hemerythrin superfamily protein
MSLVNKVKSLTARATMDGEDVRSLLIKDHDEAKTIAQQMHETSSPSRRKALLDKLKPALTAHSRAEERVVYDALLRVRADDPSHVLADEGYVEHSLVDELLTTLSSSDTASDRWKANAKVLHELLEHHIEEEQSDVFAKLGDHFDRDKLKAMGGQFLRDKATILSEIKKLVKNVAARGRGVAKQAARKSAPKTRNAVSRQRLARGAARSNQKRVIAE